VAGFARITGSDRDVREDSVPLPTNAWSHVALTYDKAQSSLKLWIDGVPHDERIITGDIEVSTLPLFIGGNQVWGEYFNGQIDNIRIYNRALNIVELQTNLAAPVQ